MKNPLSVPDSPPTEFWLELVQEAENYARLVRTLTESELSPEEREKHEQELLGSVSHIRVHSRVLDESVTEALERADDAESN